MDDTVTWFEVATADPEGTPGHLFRIFHPRP